MSYFSKFPYVSTYQDGQYLVVRDFFRRIGLSEKFKINTIFLENYLVMDGETPDLVSAKFYETPKYHWIILLVNEMIDPRTEWPIAERQIIEKVYMDYDAIITVPTSSSYSVNDELTTNTGGKFIVMNKNGNDIFIRSQSGFTPLTSATIITNETTNVTGLTISSVVLPENRVHHYFDTELQYIVDNDPGNLNIIPITNYEHETETNDAKRSIKILPPTYISTFEREFNRLIGL